MRDKYDRGWGKPQDEGSTIASRYWGDLMSLSRGLVQQNLSQTAAILQRTLRGGSMTQRIEGLTQLWLQSARNIAQISVFPVEWLMREMMHPPTLLFMVDRYAEATAPQTVLTPFSIGDLPVRCTDLQQNAAMGKIPAAHVGVRVVDAGNRVEVWLADLGGTPEERQKRGIVPGHYLGVIYAEEAPTQRPLTIVHVIVGGESSLSESSAEPR